MQISRIATLAVVRTSPSAPALEAAELMKFHDVGMIVVEEEKRTLGVVTDRDIATRIVADGLDPRKTVVRDVMSHPAIWLYEDAQIEDAVHLMSRQQVRRVVVLNHKREAVGVLSLDDLASYTGGDETAGRILEKIARRPMVESLGGRGYHGESDPPPS